MPDIDFTSSLYLNMKHASTELVHWSQLTAGIPAAIYEPERSRSVARLLAQMQGLDNGLLAPSTLHLYYDLYGLLCKMKITLFIDQRIYPVSKYGLEKLLVKSIPVYPFKHLNAEHLFKQIKAKLRKATIPVVLTDGWCPPCGKPAPLIDYFQIISEFGGMVIIDDTQAFGILGKKKDHFIYGSGGGGILQWLNMKGPGIITIISLAKAFGVPMAVLSGSKEVIEAFKTNSETRVNSSPVSFADLSAGLNMLTINNLTGDHRRKQLLNNVLLLRNGLMQKGIDLQGSFFPVQSISLKEKALIKLNKKLNFSRFKTVLINGHIKPGPLLSLMIRTDHLAGEINSLVHAIQLNIPGLRTVQPYVSVQ